MYLAGLSLTCSTRDLWLQHLDSSGWWAQYLRGRGVLVTPPGMEPASHALQGRLVATGAPGKSLIVCYVCMFRVLINTSLYFVCMFHVSALSVKLYPEHFLADWEGPGELPHDFLRGRI